MLVVLDVQHWGRVGRIDDRGAVHAGREEVCLAMRYVLAADYRLRRRGHQCVVLSDGSYRERWVRADALNANVYVACHVNGGGGDYGRVYYDPRSRVGPALAQQVTGKLAHRVPWPVAREPAELDGRTGATIRGVVAPALLFEPYFVDGPAVGDFERLLPMVGWALADGIVG